jgi:hypothetical protein
LLLTRFLLIGGLNKCGVSLAIIIVQHTVYSRYCSSRYCSFKILFIQELTKAFQQARCLRDRVEDGTLEKREADRVVETVFGQFAESMNKIELWTGEEQTSTNVSSLADQA